MNRTKQIQELLDEKNLDDSFVIGFYGGGNFGDELLFEVLQHLFYARKYTRVSYLYQHPSGYQRHHNNLGYKPVDAARKWDILRAIFTRKRLVIGGGGLWGLDVNLNIFLMSFMLFISRILLGKEVYLLGVGYYNSTNKLGRVSAWLAGKSANQILARDDESYKNFSHLNRFTYLSDDIAFTLNEVKEDVSKELAAFEENVCRIDEPTVMISLRRFKAGRGDGYVHAVESWLNAHPNTRVILALMEPRENDPVGFAQLKSWQRQRGNAVVIDFDYNPLVLYRFFKTYHNKLAYIGPQFHVQLVAHLAGVKLMPLVYDNKVAELLRKLQYDNPLKLENISPEHIKQFVGSKGSA